jgi:hypothetical protein
MINKFRYYFIYWSILFILFNTVAFAFLGGTTGGRYTESFWVGYAIVTLAFIGQLGITHAAFKTKNIQKFFYNISLINISYISLIITALVGGISMTITGIPYWIVIFVFALIFAIVLMALVKAKAAVVIVGEIDDRIKKQTSYIRALMIDAETLVNRAESLVLRDIATKISDAIKYSDPMSHRDLQQIEKRIQTKFWELYDSINNKDENRAEIISSELHYLIIDRNNRCKLLK